MAQILESVLDWEVDTEYHDDLTVHLYQESWVAEPRTELWRHKRFLGAGGFGTVCLEERIDSDHQTRVRAVKTVPIGKKSLSSATHIRELEAMIKFSSQRVNYLCSHPDLGTEILS